MVLLASLFLKSQVFICHLQFSSFYTEYIKKKRKWRATCQSFYITGEMCFEPSHSSEAYALKGTGTALYSFDPKQKKLGKVIQRTRWKWDLNELQSSTMGLSTILIALFFSSKWKFPWEETQVKEACYLYFQIHQWQNVLFHSYLPNIYILLPNHSHFRSSISWHTT